MLSERSQQNARGALYLVAVPIGHVDDITVRAIHILRDADVIVSENPAATRLLLTHHNIDTTITSYGPAHIEEKVAVLIDRLLKGMRIAFVSDCGSPVIADPGSCLVTAAHAHGIQVVSIPGPSALTAAVAAAGFPSDTILFLGQLPRTRSGIRRRLSIAPSGHITTVAFCGPDTLAPAIRTIAESAPRLRIVLACDLTTPRERIVTGTVSTVSRILHEFETGQDMTLIFRRPARQSAMKKRGKKTARGQSASSRRITTR